MKLVVVLYCIVILLNWPVDSRKCYLCNCQYDWGTNTGSCSSPDFLSGCLLGEVGNEYCHMLSAYNDNMETRIFDAVASNTLQDSHFIQAVETISLSGTAWLPTKINSISYGCDWDGCNYMNLSQYLPESFQMKIDQTILNSALIDEQTVTPSCYTCSHCIDQITGFACKPGSCINGICYIDEIHNYVVTSTNNCTYNFASYCQPFTDRVQPPSIRIRATYYIDFPQEKQIAIDEVDIMCTKDNCNSIVTVENLKGQVQTDINIPSEFRPLRPTDTTTAGLLTSTLTSTAQGFKSSQSYPIIFLYLILFLSLL